MQVLPGPACCSRSRIGSFPRGSSRQTRTGRFRVEGLAPAVKYTLEVVEKGKATARVFAGLTLKAAEVKDLGEIQAKAINE